MTENNMCGTGGCGCAPGAKTGFEEKSAAREAVRKTVDIEFLYLDLNVCEPCRGSESNLDEALADVALLLEQTGVALSVKKIHVETFEQAQALGFMSSPTIRVNGRDAALGVEENYCASCSDLSGSETFCRVWNFRGEQFSTAPKPLVVEAILREIYGSGKNEPAEISAARAARARENLKRFFDGRKERSGDSQNAPSAPVELPATACEPTKAGGGSCCA